MTGLGSCMVTVKKWPVTTSDNGWSGALVGLSWDSIAKQVTEQWRWTLDKADVKVPKPRQSGKRAKKGNKTRLKKAKKERKTSLKTNNDNKTKLKHKAARTKTAKKVKNDQKKPKNNRRRNHRPAQVRRRKEGRDTSRLERNLI